MEHAIERIQSGVSHRQDEIRKSAVHLGERAKLNNRAATVAKVMLVAFGALAATKSTADQILGTGSTSSAAVYAILGVLTAIVAGISAAFEFDRRSAQMTQLAAEAWSAVREADTQWRHQVVMAQPHEAPGAALEVIDFQDSKLADIQARAARLGVNVAIDIPVLIQPGVGTIYPA